MIDFSKTRHYTLSIRLSADGFCFAVHNPLAVDEYAYQPYRIDSQKSLTANLKEAAKEIEILKHTYKTVNIIIADTDYTIVPKEFYAESHKTELFHKNISSSNTNITILQNPAGDEQAVILFSIETQLYKYLTERFPKATIYAAITPLVNFGVEKSYSSPNKYCLLYLHKRKIDFMCFDKATPLFINTFDCRDTANMLYFLLSCWSTLGLSQIDDTLHIAGRTRQSKEIQAELAKFICNIHPIRPSEEFHSTELVRVDEMPFDFQALISSCE